MYELYPPLVSHDPTRMSVVMCGLTIDDVITPLDG
jgi:hypothetical protein